jgi:Calx-beta domain
MRTLLRRIAIAGGTTIAVIGMLPAVAHAARTATITVDNVSGYEGVVVCDDFGSPPCGSVQANSLFFYIRISNGPPNKAVTVDWQLVDGTATYGNDFTGPVSGTITIAAGTVAQSMSVPLVSDGFNESTEQLTVHLSHPSVSANLGDGTETILDGTQIPADCSVANPSGGLVTMACTARPATQQWHLRLTCYPFGKPIMHFGNIVTGNGTSSVDCTGLPFDDPFFSLV